nr:DUF58 domain-containing protein [Lachnospiraceae bacterium]
MKHRSLLILTALIILALVGISFYGGPVTYVFFMLVILVPLVCYCYLFFVTSSLKIYERSDGRTMVCSAPSDFYITLNNESFISFSSVKITLYSSFSTVTGLDEDAVYELPPHSSVTRKTTLVCKYRGEYLVGIKEITVKDPLGLFSLTRKISEPLSVIVAPAMVELESLRIGDDLADADRDSLTGRTRKDIPVREYVAGDDTRLINHKASALMQKPMVRELSGIESSRIVIVMDPKRCDQSPEKHLPAENRIIESTLALSMYYAGKNIPVEVIYETDRMICDPVADHGDCERLYETMKGYVFRDAAGRLMLLDELCTSNQTEDCRMMIFIFHDLDDGVIDA